MSDRLGERLLALAHRLDRLRPQSHDPEAYFVERDDIRRALMREAERLDARATLAAARGRFTAGAVVVEGRRVQVERRGERARTSGFSPRREGAAIPLLETTWPRRGSSTS